jgi:hypothetical protein
MTDQESQAPADSGALQGRDERLQQLAHDLRNHLYVIGLSTALLRKKTPSPAELDEILACLASEHKQAVDALNELVRVARNP